MFRGYKFIFKLFWSKIKKMKYVYLLITIIGVIYLLGNYIGYNYANQNGVGIELDLFYKIVFLGVPICVTLICGYLSYTKFKSTN